MKVICDSCGSKYQIKDEKVRGKRVKIRCKGCKNAIVVDGTAIGEGETQVRASIAPPPDTSAKQPEPEPEPEPAPAAAAPAPAPPSPAVSPAAPAVQASPAPGPTAAAPAARESSPPPATTWTVNLSDTDNRDMTTDEIVAGWKAGTVTDDAYVFKEGFNDWTPILDVPELAHLVGSAADAAPTPFAPPAGASPFGGARAATAQRSGDMFGAAAAAEASEPPAPVFPSAAAGKGAGTGARNESSVLFSLDALKAGFSEPAPPKPVAVASSEDPFDLGGPGSIGGLSGGLVANQALLAAPPPEPKKKPKPKPVVAKEGEAPPPAAMSRGKMILIGVGALAAMILVGVVGFALGGGSSDEEAVAKNDVADDGSSGVRTGKSDEKKSDDKDEKSDDEKAEKKDEKAEADDKDKDEKKDEKAEADDKGKDEKKDEKSVASKSGGGTTSSKSDDKKPDRKTEKKPEKAESAAGAFDKGSARSALASAAANAATCKIPGGPTGSGKAIVTFAPSGRVTTANVVGGKFGGTSVGGCVASRFRRARVPPFSGGPITVSKSFTIQ